MKNNGSWTIVRWGLAFVFFYAAIASVARPEHWMIYVPSFIAAFAEPNAFLVAFSLFELILAGFLFAGIKRRASALTAAITYAAIVAVDFRFMNMVFMNVGLAFASLALFEAARYDRRIPTNNHNEPQR